MSHTFDDHVVAHGEAQPDNEGVSVVQAISRLIRIQPDQTLGSAKYTLLPVSAQSLYLDGSCQLC